MMLRLVSLARMYNLHKNNTTADAAKAIHAQLKLAKCSTTATSAAYIATVAMRDILFVI
jgi:hypothetical protein